MAKPFTEVFPELSLQEDARERMAQCTVARITMNPGKDFMKIYLESDKLIHKGRREYMQLLKRVAYYEMFGYDEEVKFI